MFSQFDKMCLCASEYNQMHLCVASLAVIDIDLGLWNYVEKKVKSSTTGERIVILIDVKS